MVSQFNDYRQRFGTGVYLAPNGKLYDHVAVPPPIFRAVQAMAMEMTKKGGLELLSNTDFRAYKFAPPKAVKILPSVSVWISVIRYDQSATEYYPVFDGTDGAVKAKWDTMVTYAENYKYAEQPDAGGKDVPTFTGKFVNWPNSIYETTGTNSRTFIVQELRNSDLPFQ